MQRAAKVKATSTASKATSLVGPASPTSNLRPVWIAPLFPPAHAANRTRSEHPYSLSEFPVSAGQLPPRLRALRDQLAAEDLQYRLLLNRNHDFSEHFWRATNEKFAASKAEAVEAGLAEEADGLWLKRNAPEYQAYHRRFYVSQFGELLPAARAWQRRIRWKLACWRAGVPHGLD